MITDEDFRDIAAAAYKVDPLWTNPPWKRGQGIPPSDPRYAIIEEPVNDPATGFQAITVAPLKPNSKVDTDPSQVYVAFAGTNPAHHADINTDAQAVIAGKVSATQTEQAKEYAEKIRAKYRGANFTAVGHSLGGYMAMFVAAELHWSCTSFNGPDPWEQLSPQAKKWVKERIAADKNSFRNWVNEWDLVGAFHGDGTGASIYVKGTPGQDMLTIHNLSTGFSFDEKTGQIQGADVSGRNWYQIMENLLHDVPPMLREPIAGLAAGAVGALQIPVVGGGVGRSVSTVLVMMDTIAATSLASNIFSASDMLTTIKSVNSGLPVQLQRNLDEAKSSVYSIPFITEADIENCVAVQRLRVEDNLDEHAVADVNRRIDDHLDTVHKLHDGISNAVLRAGEQDARWALAFGGK